jgi:hypothetical protein
MDSGESGHFTKDNVGFTNIEPCKSTVTVADGITKIKGNWKGTSPEGIIMKHLNGLNLNILSTGTFDKDGYSSLFHKMNFYLYDRLNMRIKMTFKINEESNLYYKEDIDYEKNKRYISINNELITTHYQEQLKSTNNKTKNDLLNLESAYLLDRNCLGQYHGSRIIKNLENKTILHLILNHASKKKIHHMIKHNVVDGMNTTIEEYQNLIKEDWTFTICLRSRMRANHVPSRNPFIKEINRPRIHEEVLTLNNRPLPHKWFCDIVKMSNLSKQGNLYTIIFVTRLGSNYEDGYYIYPTYCKIKEDFIECVKRLTENVLKKNGLTLDIISSDYESVLRDKSLDSTFKEFGTSRNYSAPYKKQQNYAERCIQSVFNDWRCNMQQYQAPSDLWEYCLNYTCYVMNRIPKKIINSYTI